MYSVVRYAPKDFRPFLPDGLGGWKTSPGLHPQRPTLYHLPEVVAAVDAGRTVYIVEGEKDVESLRALGRVATTLGSAGARWNASVVGPLRGAHVAIIPDNDAPGARYAANAAECLRDVAEDVRVLRLPLVGSGGDITDWLEAGHTSDQLDVLFENAPVQQPSDGERVSHLDHPPMAADAARVRPAGLRGRSLDSIRLDLVTEEYIEWIWPGRLPRGKLWPLEGHPGTGKSLVTMAIAAAVSRGIGLPGASSAAVADVVFVALEDGIADTIQPRAKGAGADLERIHVVQQVIEGEYSRPPRLPDDIDLIREEVLRVGAALVIIDPLNAYLSGSVDTHKAQDVQRALFPFARLAEETNATILVVRHLTKHRGGSAITAGGGSMGIIGTARGALLLAEDPENSERRILAVSKSNLARKPTAIALRIEDDGNGPRVVWDGEVSYSADDLVADPETSPHGALDEAKEWLEEHLADGPVTKQAAITAGRSANIRGRTLERAAKELNVQAQRLGEGRGVFWALAISANSAKSDALAGLADLAEDSAPGPLSIGIDAGSEPTP